MYMYNLNVHVFTLSLMQSQATPTFISSTRYPLARLVIASTDSKVFLASSSEGGGGGGGEEEERGRES